VVVAVAAFSAARTSESLQWLATPALVIPLGLIAPLALLNCFALEYFRFRKALPRQGVINRIKGALPPDHALRNHRLYPGSKLERRDIFIVDDDTARQYLLINFEKMKRWKKTQSRVPTIRVFKNRQQMAELFERNHWDENLNE
jgi:hypothetical protein